jgi:ABC-type antimicrobial peptide transport system permease subunit
VDGTLALGNVEPMTAVVDRDSRRHRALASVLSAFGILGLAVAMLGLYAALAYVVSQRRREIAVRVAIGANESAVRRLVLDEGAVLVAMGLVLGSVASLGMTRLIASQLYGVTATDPGTFAGIAALLGASASIASLAPIRQATSVQPAEILRSE